MYPIKRGLAIVIIIASPFFYADANESQLDQLVKKQEQNHYQGMQSQKRVSQLANDTKDLLHEYRIILRQIENTRSYNTQLRKLIENQKAESISIREQIVEVKQTGKEIVPLMLEMLETLKKFIALDLPFLMQERTKRVAKLEKIMNRADVSVSEKYRRIMQAYQIENEYGRTLEAYKGMQTVENKKLNVDYLRVGRVALIYQTLDRKHQAYWDHNKKQWASLSLRYRQSITDGLKVAKKQKAPSLLTIPVSFPIKTKIKSL